MVRSILWIVEKCKLDSSGRPCREELLDRNSKRGSHSFLTARPAVVRVWRGKLAFGTTVCKIVLLEVLQRNVRVVVLYTKVERYTTVSVATTTSSSRG